MTPLPLHSWITRRIVALRERGATVRIFDADPTQQVRVPYEISLTQYAPRMYLDRGTLITELPIKVPSLDRQYWIVVFPPDNPTGFYAPGLRLEDGTLDPSNTGITLYDVRGWGFNFDPNEPGKHWAGFRWSPGGNITPIIDQKKSHINEVTAWATLAFAGAVAVGELVIGAAAGAETAAGAAGAEAATGAAGAEAAAGASIADAVAGAEFIGPAIPEFVGPVAPEVAGGGAGITLADIGKTAVGIANGTVAVAGAITQVSAALNNSGGGNTAPPPDPPADNTIYWMVGAILVIGVLL